MVAVGVVQVAIDQIVDVIAVGDGFVAAALSMDVSSIMSAALMVGGAAVRVLVSDLNHMLIDVIAVRMMQMRIVQIVDVALMAYRDMTTLWAVNMGMVGVVWKITVRHFASPLASDVRARARPCSTRD
jgi:hypothetical protein